MFLDVGPIEVAFLLVLGVILFGPDKLPKLIGEVVQFIRKVRAYSDSATREIRSELGPEFDDFDLRDLNPGSFARRHLAGHGDEFGLTEIKGLRHDLDEGTRAVARTVQTEPEHDDPETDLISTPAKSVPLSASDETKDPPWPPPPPHPSTPDHAERGYPAR